MSWLAGPDRPYRLTRGDNDGRRAAPAKRLDTGMGLPV